MIYRERELSDNNPYTTPGAPVAANRVFAPSRRSDIASACLAFTGSIALVGAATSLLWQDVSVFNPAFKAWGPVVYLMGFAVFTVQTVAGLRSRKYGIHSVGVLAVVATCILVFDTPTAPFICPWSLGAIGILIFERWRASPAEIDSKEDPIR